MLSYRLPFWSRWRQENGDPPVGIGNGGGRMLPQSNGASHDPSPPASDTLAGFDEIYTTAHIPDPKLGYSILKIAEMLESGFIRGLAPDVKRNSVLMALEAAGVRLEDVLQDATARQRALCVYENQQQQRLDEFAAQEAQKIVDVSAELEHVNADYAARIKTSRDEVVRLQERFKSWQASKSAEAQRLTDAVALCVSQSKLEVATSALERRPQMALSPPSE